MRSTLIILFTLALASTRASDKATTPDFSRYTQISLFRHTVSEQTNATWHLQCTNILAMSEFPMGGGFAFQSYVTDSGKKHGHIDVGLSMYRERGGQLSETDLKTLRAAMRDLPPESVSPPIERLVIVSFRDGTNWVTRSYDTGNLPKSMRPIYDIMRIRTRFVRSFTVQ